MSVRLLGFRVDNYNFEEGIDKALELLEQEKVSQVVTINPEMFAEAEKNAEFANIINNAEMIIPDGIGVKIALQLKGYNAQRLPGIDFAKRLLQEAALKNISVGIIGAKEEVITKAVENLKNEIKNLNVVYYHNGYFSDDNEIYEDLQKTEPRLILAALGSPKQEFFIYNAKNKLSKALMIGIGGSLDVWSGNVKRAPEIYQKLGLEWLYRTISQPERFKRIFPALPLFLLKVIMSKEDKK